MKYRAKIDSGEGGDMTIEAPNISRALEIAIKWAEEGANEPREGEWYACEVEVYACHDCTIRRQARIDHDPNAND